MQKSFSIIILTALLLVSCGKAEVATVVVTPMAATEIESLTPSPTGTVTPSLTPAYWETAVARVRGTRTAQAEEDPEWQNGNLTAWAESRNLTKTILALTSSPTPTKTCTPTLTPNLPPNGYSLFFDDFETGKEKWVFLQPDFLVWEVIQDDSIWKIQAGENGNHYLCAYADDIGSTLARIGDINWTNYRLKFDYMALKFDDVTTVSFFQVRDNEDYSQTYYSFGFMFFDQNQDTFGTEKHTVGFWKSPWTEEEGNSITNELPEKIRKNQWNSIVIRVFEGDISFFLNDDEIINFTDDEYIPKGKISFGAYRGTFCFDNVHVTFIESSEQ